MFTYQIHTSSAHEVRELPMDLYYFHAVRIKQNND